MSKAQLDSDLYGDLYGDDAETMNENTPDSPTANWTDAPISPTTTTTTTTTATATSPTNVSPESANLPAKPTSDSASSSPSISYSAQIAHQFSAYQQTPSQERQIKKHPVSGQSQMSFAVATGSAPQDGIFGKKPSEMHDAGKIFIGGLNWDTTDEGLRDYMSQFGKVDAITIMRDPSGTSRGFAFMTYEDPNVLDAVLSKQHFLDGKLIDPKRAIPREEHLRNTRYFVGGLAPATTPETMKTFFSAFGKVVDATVMMDRESNRSKGFGFVTFEDATQSTTDAIVGKIGLILDEKEIEVKQAQPRNQRDIRPGGVGTMTSLPSPTTSLPNLNNTSNNNNVAMATTNPMLNTPQSMNNQAALMGMPFLNPQQQQMFRSAGMNGGGAAPNMMGGNMMGGGGGGGGGMAMNPMMMAAMGGMGMNPMMNMGMGGMGMMNGMGGMGMMNGMAGGGVPNMGIGGMGMMNGMGRMGGMMGSGIGGVGVGVPGMQRPSVPVVGGMGRMNNGVGPSRTSQRGQHNFHPYSR